jgi:hypothetical protein
VAQPLLFPEGEKQPMSGNEPIQSAARFAVKMKWFVRIITVAALLVSLGFLLVSSRSSIRHVERLNAPIGVIGWNEDGLQLSDGRILQLPGFKRLPTTSSALAEATKSGVDITREGRVIGLITIHHWCGNDPVREHVARVDLALMLRFLSQGEALGPLTHEYMIPSHPSEIEQSGWEPSSYMVFETWSELQLTGAR